MKARTPWTFRPASWMNRSRLGVYVMRYTWTPLDRLMLKLTRGRVNLAPNMVPELVLTTTGRKSGEPRANPVLYLEDGGRFVIVSSNYGRKTRPVRARRATPEEFERYWPRFTNLWAGWKTYRRMTDREFPVFVLEPVPEPP